LVSGVVNSTDGVKRIVCSSVSKAKEGLSVKKAKFVGSFNDQSKVVSRWGLMAVRIVDNLHDPSKTDVEWLLTNCTPVSDDQMETTNSVDDGIYTLRKFLTFFQVKYVNWLDLSLTMGSFLALL
jgi:hypothetical protein